MLKCAGTFKTGLIQPAKAMEASYSRKEPAAFAASYISSGHTEA